MTENDKKDIEKEIPPNSPVVTDDDIDDIDNHVAASDVDEVRQDDDTSSTANNLVPQENHHDRDDNDLDEDTVIRDQIARENALARDRNFNEIPVLNEDHKKELEEFDKRLEILKLTFIRKGWFYLNKNDPLYIFYSLNLFNLQELEKITKTYLLDVAKNIEAKAVIAQKEFTEKVGDVLEDRLSDMTSGDDGLSDDGLDKLFTALEELTQKYLDIDKKVNAVGAIAVQNTDRLKVIYESLNDLKKNGASPQSDNNQKEKKENIIKRTFQYISGQVSTFSLWVMISILIFALICLIIAYIR